VGGRPLGADDVDRRLVKVPTRARSPLPITMPSRSVISTLNPMMSVVSPAISWASCGVSTGATTGWAMCEAYNCLC